MISVSLPFCYFGLGFKDFGLRICGFSCKLEFEEFVWGLAVCVCLFSSAPLQEPQGKCRFWRPPSCLHKPVHHLVCSSRSLPSYHPQEERVTSPTYLQRSFLLACLKPLSGSCTCKTLELCGYRGSCITCISAFTECVMVTIIKQIMEKTDGLHT